MWDKQYSQYTVSELPTLDPTIHIMMHKVFHISYAYINQSTYCGNKDPIIYGYMI